MTADKSKFDHRSKDANRAGSFLRARWHQWLKRRDNVKASYLVGQPPADSIAPSVSPGRSARLAAKNADSAASRNAQNCTFEVF
jgi:hypothetical protein